MSYVEVSLVQEWYFYGRRGEVRSGEGYLVMASRGFFRQVWRVVVRWVTIAVDWGMVL